MNIKKIFNRNKLQNKSEEIKFKDENYSLENMIKRANNFKTWPIWLHEIIKTLKINTNDKLLDAGCSVCTYEYLLEKSNINTKNIIGVDISAKCIVAVNRNKKQLNIKNKLCANDIEELGFKNSTFDKIMCINTLHHFPEKSFINVLKEFKRVLKPGGILFSIEPNIINPLIFKSHLTEKWSMNEFPYTPFKMETMFKLVFGNVETKMFRFFPGKNISLNKFPIIKYLGKQVILKSIMN